MPGMRISFAKQITDLLAEGQSLNPFAQWRKQKSKLWNHIL
jgi:hypothetical protein